MKNKVVVYTDGSFTDRKPEVSGWGIVVVLNDVIIHEDYGQARPDSRQIGGELKAAMMGMLWARQNGFQHVEIHHDYTGVAWFVDGTWKKPKKELPKKYIEFTNKAMSVIDISFVKVKAHTGNYYNERADALANKGVNEG
jgi:ribonuclease HI